MAEWLNENEIKNFNKTKSNPKIGPLVRLINLKIT